MNNLRELATSFNAQSCFNSRVCNNVQINK